MQPHRLVGQRFHQSQLHRLAGQRPQRPVIMTLRSRAAGQGHKVGFHLVVHLPVLVDLVVVPQHLLQSLLGIPPLGAEHRTLRHVQGRSHLGGGPTLVYLEQDARPGNRLGGTPASPDHPPEPSLFLDSQNIPCTMDAPPTTQPLSKRQHPGSDRLMPDNTALTRYWTSTAPANINTVPRDGGWARGAFQQSRLTFGGFPYCDTGAQGFCPLD